MSIVVKACVPWENRCFCKLTLFLGKSVMLQSYGTVFCKIQGTSTWPVVVMRNLITNYIYSVNVSFICFQSVQVYFHQVCICASGRCTSHLFLLLLYLCLLFAHVFYFKLNYRTLDLYMFSLRLQKQSLQQNKVGQTNLERSITKP